MKAMRIAAVLLPWLWLVLFSVSASCAEAQAAHASPVREADAVCGRCHRQILQSYLETPMANASGLASERLMSGSYTQTAAGVRYNVAKVKGQATLSYTIPPAVKGAAAVEGKERLEYFLGSGHLGLTYLYEKNGYWLESPVAFYAKLQGYAMKPGLEASLEMPAALPLSPGCLRCHMSGVQKQVAGTANLYRQMPFQQVGITCESCHGDTRQHVLAGGHAPVVNPLKLSPALRDSTCIVCHLEGDTHVERAGRDVLDFVPGDNISDSMSYFVHVGQNTTRRAVSEIEQFSESRCKRVSGPGMSCMNCHDPHRSPAPAERVSFYRAKCLACHTAPAIARDHFPASPDCTGCHMPKTGSENIAHVAWTDHRIRRVPGELELKALGADRPHDGGADLVPLLPGADGLRDVGLAYYDLVVNGVPAARPKAWRLLSAAAEANPRDALVLRSLGILAQGDGEAGEAARLYRASLKVDPDNFVAATNLGALLVRSGDLEEAATLWSGVFRLNQDIPALGRNLAAVECRLGEQAMAEEVLAMVLTYSPGLLDPRRELAAMRSDPEQCVASPVRAPGPIESLPGRR